MAVTEGDDRDERASQDTERGRDFHELVDEVGAHDAFIAGMIYALSRRICPGPPYTPRASGRQDPDGSGTATDDVRARWRLDECLKFATELAGRKARRKTWDGLAEEMMRAGWFDL
jgi:sugar/nucleoside kinase (ribokinase family)